jgi:hypothetical protein
VDGTAATAPVLNDALKAGSRIKLHLLRGGAGQDVEIEVAKNMKKTFTLAPAANPTAAQLAILSHWLRTGQ